MRGKERQRHRWPGSQTRGWGSGWTITTKKTQQQPPCSNTAAVSGDSSKSECGRNRREDAAHSLPRWLLSLRRLWALGQRKCGWNATSQVLFANSTKKSPQSRNYVSCSGVPFRPQLPRVRRKRKVSKNKDNAHQHHVDK